MNEDEAKQRIGRAFPLKKQRTVADFVEYGAATDVWVEDGHVFTRREDGTVVRMVPEVAITIGRKLEAAGTESFINKIMDGRATTEDFPHDRG
ncbi:hypothetical protein [Sphingomonas melonis]